jgi:transcriptional regulator with XRE-family HTH domain
MQTDPRMFPLIDATGADLVAWRRLVGWTQRDLAACLGVSRRSIQNYEHDGASVPRLVGLALRYLGACQAAGTLADVDPQNQNANPVRAL